AVYALSLHDALPIYRFRRGACRARRGRRRRAPVARGDGPMSPRGFALVDGGARSGKSTFALRLAMQRGERRVFIATAEAFDDERSEEHTSELQSPCK